MLTAMIVLVTSSYITFEWIKYLKQRSIRENIVLSILILVAMGMGCMHLLKTAVPNPLEVITATFSPIARMLHAIFK